jgi:hypothetical protein
MVVLGRLQSEQHALALQVQALGVNVKKIWIMSAAISAVAVAASVGVISSASWASSPIPNAAATPRTDSAAEYGIALLTRPQAASDAAPSWVNLDSVGYAGVTPASVRLIASSDGTAYWIAQGRQQGELCVIAGLLSEKAAGSDCTSADQFANEALAIRVSGLHSAAEGYVIPDKERKAFDSKAAVNLVTVNPLATTADRTESSVAKNLLSKTATQSASTGGDGYTLGLLSAPTAQQVAPSLRAEIEEASGLLTR